MGIGLRALAGSVGAALIGLGVWGVFHAKQDAATAALVTAGVVLFLVALIGGLERLKLGELEAVFAAQSGRGDDELTLDLARRVLDEADPDAARYRRAAMAAVLEAAKDLGLPATPVQSIEGINALVAGSVIGVDIRTGTHFDLSRVARTYRVLLDRQIPVLDAVVTVVRCSPNSTAIRSLHSLQLPGPLLPVAWRSGDSVKPIMTALINARRAIDSSHPDSPG
jgi:hypothetical protein